MSPSSRKEVSSARYNVSVTVAPRGGTVTRVAGPPRGLRRGEVSDSKLKVQERGANPRAERAEAKLAEQRRDLDSRSHDLGILRVQHSTMRDDLDNVKTKLKRVEAREKLLREAAEEVAEGVCSFKDDRLSYEEWQLNPGSIERLRAALASLESATPEVK